MSRRPGGSFVGVLAATLATAGVAGAVGVTGDVVVVPSETVAVGGLTALGAAAVLALAVASDPDVDDRDSLGADVTGRRVAADGAGGPADAGSGQGNASGATASRADADDPEDAGGVLVGAPDEDQSPERHGVGGEPVESASTESQTLADDSMPSDRATTASGDAAPTKVGPTDATDWAFRDDTETEPQSADTNENEDGVDAVGADESESEPTGAFAPVEDAEWEFDPELAPPRDAE